VKTNISLDFRFSWRLFLVDFFLGLIFRPENTDCRLISLPLLSLSPALKTLLAA
jgi:hypothetical protein